MRPGPLTLQTFFKQKALGPALYIKPNGNTPAEYKVSYKADKRENKTSPAKK
jgi:hypothetical protein